MDWRLVVAVGLGLGAFTVVVWTWWSYMKPRPQNAPTQEPWERQLDEIMKSPLQSDAFVISRGAYFVTLGLDKLRREIHESSESANKLASINTVLAAVIAMATLVATFLTWFQIASQK